MDLRLPLFIVFEGIDGSGKSTLAQKVFKHFSQDVSCLLLSEPTGDRWGRKIRKLLQTPDSAETSLLLELFIRDRSDDVRKNISPALSEGKLIVMDRYMHSNAAYQGRGEISPQEIIAMNLAKGFPLPDRVYFIDIEEEAALSRVKNRKNGVECFERTEILHSIRKNYYSLIDDTFLVLDGLKNPDVLTQEIICDIEKYFTCK